MRKIISILLVACMLIASVPAALAADNRDYVALGDSITLGTGLDEPEAHRFSTLLADYWDADCTNFGVNGLDSDTLLANLRAGMYTSAIEEAEVITLGIGSNDLLAPLKDIAGDIFGIDLDTAPAETLKEFLSTASPAELLSMIVEIEAAIQSTDAEKLFIQEVLEFSANWSAVIDEIISINPDAELVAIDLYNPMYEMYYRNMLLTYIVGKDTIDFRTVADEYITEMNSVIITHHEADGRYTLVSIYDVFNADGMVNIDLNLSDFTNVTFTFDPHPTIKGHGCIAELIAASVTPSFGDDDTESGGENDDAGFHHFIPRKEYSMNMFSDVDEINKWYGAGEGREGVIKAVYEYGLMDGMGDGIFSPEGSVTIAQAITMACRIHNIYNGGSANFPASDPWYMPYIEYALGNGIIKISDFTDYNKVATRAETAYIFANALPAEGYEPVREVSSIPDVDTSYKYSDAIYTLYEAGILSGNDAAGTFTPETPIQRCAAAAIIARIACIVPRQTNTIGA